MKQYSKREFLRMMGLGLAFMPFISCFDSSSPQQNAAKDTPNGAAPPEPEEPIDDILVADPADVILLSRTAADYAVYNTSFNARIQHMPQYIALCKTTEGVIWAVNFARRQNIPIAVKSGGHSFEGFSGNDGGMVINVSQMKKVSWSGTDIVDIEPGCTLAEVQAALFARKRLIPSGSCGSVGISGLTLGGGYGFFSRQYGLTCDNLTGLELVAGDGKVHTADEELLWACRGGGNGNFGVATRLRFRTHPMPATFSSLVLKFRKLDADRFETLLQTWFRNSGTLPQEAFSAFVLNGSTLTVLATTYASFETLERCMQPITALSDTASRSREQHLPQAMKRYYGRKGPILFKNASAGLYQGIEDISAIAGDIFTKVVQNSGLIYQINTLGGAIHSEAAEKQSCYPHRHLPYLSELQAYWEQPNRAASLLTAFEEIQTLIREAGITAQYRNYPDIHFPNWETAYYGSNYTRLQAVKKQYDPQSLFRYPQSINLP